MTSPFAPFQNALLRFQVAGGGIVTDPNGNPIPGLAVLEVNALLSQARRTNREPAAGIDPSSVWVEGFLIDPLELPDNVTPDSPCAAVWQGRHGRFWLDFAAKNAYLDALNINLVNRIQGYFLPSSFVVNGPIWVPPTQEVNELYSDVLTAATPLSAMRVCALNSSGALVHASASNLAHAYATVGLAMQAVPTGSSTKLLKEGNVTNVAWNWTVGAPIFLGENGEITQTPPTAATAAFMLRVGQVMSADAIQFEIEEPLLFGAS